MNRVGSNAFASVMGLAVLGAIGGDGPCMHVPKTKPPKLSKEQLDSAEANKVAKDQARMDKRARQAANQAKGMRHGK